VEAVVTETNVDPIARLIDFADREHDAFACVVGSSPQMLRAKALLARIASTRASTVLITGESGTGKDLVAKAMHACSQRRGGPFVNVTCSALPAHLLESELFGHERGAFTDAKARKLGLVEQADGGTLFLDEMGEMDLLLQAKLLRVLEDKTFRRIGGTVDLRVDVRVVAATHVDLRAAVAERRFREDLYYRLAVLTVHLPALRERCGDIRELASLFAQRFAREFGSPARVIAPAAMRMLEHHAWRGNVRELKNTIERAVLLARGPVLDVGDLELEGMASTDAAPSIRLPERGIDLAELERSLVMQALTRCHGNLTHAARLLGLNRDQVRYRIEKFRLSPERGRSGGCEPQMCDRPARHEAERVQQAVGRGHPLDADPVRARELADLEHGGQEHRGRDRAGRDEQ